MDFPTLDGAGDMSIGLSGLTIHQKNDADNSGDLQGDTGSAATKIGSATLIVQCQFNPSELRIEEGELELDDGQLDPTTGLSRETKASGAGRISGIGHADDLRIENDGLISPGTDGTGVLFADRFFLESGGIMELTPDSN